MGGNGRGTLIAMDRRDILRHLDVSRLYTDCLLYHPRYALTEMWKLPQALRAIDRGVFGGVAKFIGWSGFVLLRRTLFLIKNRLRSLIANNPSVQRPCRDYLVHA